MSRRAVPEGIAPRVLRVADPQAPLEGANLVALRLFPGPGDAEALDLVASALAPAAGGDTTALERAIVEAVIELMPFAGASLERLRATAPRWDGDDWLSDPAAGAGWPAEIDVRSAAREPVYALDRAAAASLGVEGDLLLGWRAGETILADLS